MKKPMAFLLVAGALAALLSPSLGSATSILGSAQSFAVLGASTVTNTGSTTIFGDVGLYPGTSIRGFPPAVVTGGTLSPNAGIVEQARIDAFSAYNSLAALSFTTDLSGQDLGQRTLFPGVYFFSSSAQLTGSLFLDAQNDPDALFVFQIGSALTTAGGNPVIEVPG